VVLTNLQGAAHRDRAIVRMKGEHSNLLKDTGRLLTPFACGPFIVVDARYAGRRCSGH